ncbi:metal ABC transporter permease [Bacillus sp. DJP31]|uniref:metal ABC transporter permease n=1 Tax=Bacillus sp. DJP31 TaxID=3409789 RepID=UPI003BB4BE49
MFSSLLAYEFMQNAFITGLMIGAIAPLLGMFLVMRRMALLADAFSHITLAGVAIGMYIGKAMPQLAYLSPIYTGVIFTAIASFFSEKLRSIYRDFQDLPLPIIMSAGVGISVIFISLADGFNTDLHGYLFGSISAISRSDVLFIILLAVIVLIVILSLYKELLLLSFDEEYANVTGVKAKFVNRLFILVVALVIACAIQITGVLLVSSLMVLPVATAMRIGRSFKQTCIFAIVLGELSVVLGIFVAYELNMPPGGVVVMISLLQLIAVNFLGKTRLYRIVHSIIPRKIRSSIDLKS